MTIIDKEEYILNGVQFIEYTALGNKKHCEVRMNNCVGFGSTVKLALEDLEIKLKMKQSINLIKLI